MARICMLVTSQLDRDPRVQKEAQIAHDAGHDVCVICRSYSGSPMPYLVKQLSVRRKNRLLAKYLERFWINIKMFWVTLLSRAQIIHANDLDTLPAAYLAAQLSRAALVYDAHELWSDGGGGRAGKFGKVLALVAERFLSTRVDAVITVSTYRAQAMVKALNIPLPTVVMNAPHYVAPDKLIPQEWLNQFDGKRVILYQGGYSETMGLTEAILSAKHLPEDIVLVFRGLGPYEATMQKTIVEEGLVDKVVMVPPVAMNDLVYSAVGADLGLVLYKPVNLNNLYAAPNKMFEYIMAGVPCVGSDLPYIREILLDSDIGVVFKPGDPVDLARAIMELINAPERLLTMKQRCQELAHHFSWSVEGAKLLEVYDAIMEKISEARR